MSSNHGIRLIFTRNHMDQLYTITVKIKRLQALWTERSRSQAVTRSRTIDATFLLTPRKFHLYLTLACVIILFARRCTAILPRTGAPLTKAFGIAVVRIIEPCIFDGFYYNIFVIYKSIFLLKEEYRIWYVGVILT